MSCDFEHRTKLQMKEEIEMRHSVLQSKLSENKVTNERRNRNETFRVAVQVVKFVRRLL